MLSKITVWGDSILKGIVLDEQKGRYVPLRDQSCLALTAKRLGIEISYPAHFGMTSEKGRLLVQRGLQQAKEEGAQAGLIGFGGNDIDYNWRAISEHPEEEHLPNTPPEQFRRNVEEMIELHERAGIMPVLMSLPPIDAPRYFNWLSRGLSAKNILQWLGDVQQIYRSHLSYDAIVREVAREKGCALLDVRQAFTKLADSLPYLCLDGIHPNLQGHALMEGVFEAGLAAI